MKKRILSMLLTLVLLTGLFAVPAAASSQYSDTAGHWAESAIDRWSGYGVIEGHNGLFNPDGELTRGQMAKILADTLGLSEQGENPFADVPADAWFTPYVLRCYAAGILSGDGINANPNTPITREEAMTMLCRAFGIKPVQNADFSVFSDGTRVSDWAAPYVAAMVNSGAVSGMGDGQLGPDAKISRGALISIVDRSVVQYINAPGSYTMTDKEGIVLVASGGVTLTGKTGADVLVTPAADGKNVTFDKATVTGAVTVQADDAKLKNQNSTLPDVDFTGENSTIEESKTPTGGGGGYIPPHTHSLTKVEAKAATCGDGNTEYWTCTCGKLFADAEGKTETTLEKVTIAGSGEHTESEIPAVAATCTETGLTAGKKCSVCDAVLEAQQTVPALGHDFTGAYQSDTSGHWHQCTRCDVTDPKAAHTYNTANCAVAAVCTVCQYEKAAGEHSWDAGTVTKAATCTEAGVRTYTCTSCQTTRTETIPAKGHTEVEIPAKAPTCTETGLTAGKKCSVCGTVTQAQQTIPATGHSWNNGVITKEPTETTEGVRTYTCTVCGAKWTENIPMMNLGNPYIRMVGDNLAVCFTIPNESIFENRDLDGIVSEATIKLGNHTLGLMNSDTIPGEYISQFYDYSEPTFYTYVYFSKNEIPSIDVCPNDLNGLSITLSFTEDAVNRYGVAQTITLENKDFVYSVAESSEVMPQSYTVEVKEKNGYDYFIFKGLDTGAYEYNMAACTRDGKFSSGPVNYGDIVAHGKKLFVGSKYNEMAGDGEYYYVIPHGRATGASVSIRRIDAAVAGNRLTLTRTAGIYPLFSGKYLGVKPADTDTGTMSVTKTSGENVGKAVFTWTVNSGEYEYLRGYIDTVDELEIGGGPNYSVDESKRSASALAGWEEGDAYSERSDVVGNWMVSLNSHIHKTNTFYIRHYFVNTNNSNFTDDSTYGSGPFLKITTQRRTAIDSVNDRILMAGDANGLYKIVQTKDEGYTTSYGVEFNGNTVTGSTYDMTNPNLWYWDGNFTTNADGSYAVNLIYYPINIK